MRRLLTTAGITVSLGFIGLTLAQQPTPLPCSGASITAECRYLPVVVKQIVPTSTATSTATATATTAASPTATATEVPASTQIQDGSFEAGPDAGIWYEQLLIITRPPLGGAYPEIRARTGQYLAWIGKEYQEVLSQRVTITPNRSTLSFYRILRSTRANCQQTDELRVSFEVPGENLVQTFPLCQAQQDADWTRVTISLAAYAGQTGNVTFELIDPGAGDVFLDDVTLIR
jgi:hypothetical protein